MDKKETVEILEVVADAIEHKDTWQLQKLISQLWEEVNQEEQIKKQQWSAKWEQV